MRAGIPARLAAALVSGAASGAHLGEALFVV